MTLTIHEKSFPSNVFQLLGNDENSATYALGWTLEHCPAFLHAFACHIAGKHLDSSDGRIDLQKPGSDGGYTDVEIHYGKDLHCIIEAKKGWVFPSLTQLRKYKPRLDREKARIKRMVSVSAATDEIARLQLPKNIDGVPLIHLSWGQIRSLAQKSLSSTKAPKERVWIESLVTHLEEYTAMNTWRDNMVYVVSLGSQAMREGGTHTWIDVVEKDNAYFHPIGDGRAKQPPNYIAFRYKGKLQSIHRIESHEIWTNVAEKNPLWCDTDRPHFVYKLGPAMRPPRALKAGSTGDSVRQARLVWCAIDTLLSGQFEYLGEAVAETKRRQEEAEKETLSSAHP